MRSEVLNLALGILEGILLGVFFYGGLWWTIQKAISSEFTAFWFLGSMILRMGVVLTGVYFVCHENLIRIFPCLLGLFIGRIAVGYFVKVMPKVMAEATDVREGGIHAPDLG